jgi:prenylcysteine oxidase/farnesylcysteine lyase
VSFNIELYLLTSLVTPGISIFNTSTSDVISWYYPHVWHSYPFEYPRVTFEDLELARGLYYTAGIESFISTMETSALMGMNVAQLILDDHLEIMGKLNAQDSSGPMGRKSGLEEL